MDTPEFDHRGVKAFLKAFTFLSPTEAESLCLLSRRLYPIAKAATKPKILNVRGPELKTRTDTSGPSLLYHRPRCLAEVLRSRNISVNLRKLTLTDFDESLTTLILFLVTSECRLLAHLKLINCKFGNICEKLPFHTACPLLKKVTLKNCTFPETLLQVVARCQSLTILDIQLPSNVLHGSLTNCLHILSSEGFVHLNILTIQGNKEVVSSAIFVPFLQKFNIPTSSCDWMNVDTICVNDSVILPAVASIEDLQMSALSLSFMFKPSESLNKDDLAKVLPSLREICFDPHAEFTVVKYSCTGSNGKFLDLVLSKYTVWTLFKTTSRFLSFVADSCGNCSSLQMVVDGTVTPRLLVTFIEKLTSLEQLEIEVPNAKKKSKDLQLMVTMVLSGLAYSGNPPAEFDSLTLKNFEAGFYDLQLIGTSLLEKGIHVSLDQEELEGDEGSDEESDAESVAESVESLAESVESDDSD